MNGGIIISDDGSIHQFGTLANPGLMLQVIAQLVPQLKSLEKKQLLDRLKQLEDTNEVQE